MIKTSHLTDDELIRHLLLRDDLSELEHDLLDRLILATDTMHELEEYVEVLQEAAHGDDT